MGGSDQTCERCIVGNSSEEKWSGSQRRLELPSSLIWYPERGQGGKEGRNVDRLRQLCSYPDISATLLRSPPTKTVCGEIPHHPEWLFLHLPAPPSHRVEAIRGHMASKRTGDGLKSHHVDHPRFSLQQNKTLRRTFSGLQHLCLLLLSQSYTSRREDLVLCLRLVRGCYVTVLP